LQTRRSARQSSDEAEALAVAALGYLASEPDRLGMFLSETGLGPENVRAAASSPGFMAAVLDYLIGNEAVLLDFAADQGIDPAAIPAARNALPGARREF
jgi:hypothetical protein